GRGARSRSASAAAANSSGPERRGEIELLDQPPGGGRLAQVEVAGVEPAGEHLPVEVGGAILGGYERLQLLDALLGVEELPPLRDVLPQVLLGQAQFLK